MLPGVLKSGSASVKLSRRFHLLLNGTGCDGKSEVILGRTKASTFRTFPCWPIRVMPHCTVPRTANSDVAPPIPLILTPW